MVFETVQEQAGRQAGVSTRQAGMLWSRRPPGRADLRTFI